MGNEYIIAAIGVLGTLLGTISGFFCTIFYERIKERERLKSEIEAAINEVMLVRVINEYPMALNKLRALLVANFHKFTGNESVMKFFNNWLSNPILYFNKPISNLYTDKQIEELHRDLTNIRL